MSATSLNHLHHPLDIHVPNLIDQVKNGQKIYIEPINDPQFQYKIKNESVCSIMHDETNTESPGWLLLLIRSSVHHFENRRIIRETWGQTKCWPSKKIVRLFLLGLPDGVHQQNDDLLSQEIDSHKDIIQQNFIDKYHNLTYKTMFALDWTTNVCPKATMLIMVDDDYFVHPKNVVRYIRQLDNKQREHFIGGNVVLNGRVVRNDDKIGMPHDMFGPSTYPPYISGGFYLISLSVVEELSIASRYTKYVHLEDIFLAIVMDKLLIKPVYIPNIRGHMHIPASRLNLDEVIASHRFQKVTEINILWTKSHSTSCMT